MKRFVFDPSTGTGCIYDNDKLIVSSQFTGIENGYLVFGSEFRVKLDILEDESEIAGVLFDPVIVFCVSRLLNRIGIDLEYDDGVYYIYPFDLPLDFISDVISLRDKIVKFDDDRNLVALKLIHRSSSIDPYRGLMYMILLWLYNIDGLSSSKLRFNNFINMMNALGIKVTEKKIDFESVRLIKRRVLDENVLIRKIELPSYLIDIHEYGDTEDYLLFMHPEVLLSSENLLLKNCYSLLLECLERINPGDVYDSIEYINLFSGLDLNSIELRDLFYKIVIPHLRRLGYKYVLMRF